MSTTDVPGANPANVDKLAMGCWAEHEDGSLIHVESVEAGTVVYSIFDVGQEPPVEYRDAMPESGFKSQFSFGLKSKDKWTWHDKTPFDWSRVMKNFPAGVKHASVTDQLNAAQRVAESLNLRAGAVRQRSLANNETLPMRRAASTIMAGIREAIDTLAKEYE